jgi:hypothetical protein
LLGIEEAFKGRLKVNVEDVHLIIDYESIFAASVDKHLGRLHKKMQTQHCWCFEAIEQSINFPLGCKVWLIEMFNYCFIVNNFLFYFVQVTYRFCCSPQVVEIQKLSKETCVTVIGQLTGLEPSTVVCRWYPAADGIGMDKLRPGIEGFYLLRDIPQLINPAMVPLAAFPDGSREKISLTLKEIHKKSW